MNVTKEENKIKYGSIKNKEIQELTKDIKKYIFSKSNNFNLEYGNFKKSLKDINAYFYKINKDNNIKKIEVDTTLTDYKKETSKIKNIKENDVIQSIILKTYLNNKKQTRKDILRNYLSNSNPKQKFKNKQNIEQAIRNINDEVVYHQHKELDYKVMKQQVIDAIIYLLR